MNEQQAQDMLNKSNAVLNNLATNMGVKFGQLEGEKAMLQAELDDANKYIEFLQKHIEELQAVQNAESETA